MSEVEAVYQNGVFKPLVEVRLPDSQRVMLTVRPLAAKNVRDWLRAAQAFQQQLANRQGLLSDSTIDIAEDRAR